jgi:hypothetical protein
MIEYSVIEYRPHYLTMRDHAPGPSSRLRQGTYTNLGHHLHVLEMDLSSEKNYLVTNFGRKGCALSTSAGRKIIGK